MIIKVLYGDNQQLLCNPDCSVINLLDYLKNKTGFQKTETLVDLSDETGLVQELDTHNSHDYATKFLTSHATYILVEKLLNAAATDHGSHRGSPAETSYKPLLDDEHLAENFTLHVHRPDTLTTKVRSRHSSKSPSPAGFKSVRGPKGSRNNSSSRAPSRKK